MHFQVQAALKLYAQMRDQLRVCVCVCVLCLRANWCVFGSHVMSVRALPQADMDSDQMSHQTESFLSTQGSDEEFEVVRAC